MHNPGADGRTWQGFRSVLGDGTVGSHVSRVSEDVKWIDGFDGKTSRL